MPATDLSGYNGAVTLPTGHGGAAKGFTIRRAMSSKNTNRYGSDRFDRWRGGSIGISGDIRIFLLKGTTETAPGIVSPTPDGSTITLTLEIGCTLSGIAIFPDFNLDHTFDDPAIEAVHAYRFNGTVTETWATM